MKIGKLVHQAGMFLPVSSYSTHLHVLNSCYVKLAIVLLRGCSDQPGSEYLSRRPHGDVGREVAGRDRPELHRQRAVALTLDLKQ